MEFEALPERESAVDACARAVRGAILGGELAPGERLPPERKLSARLGVSRLTLRAGLAKLAATGLLAVRQGSGYVVRDFRRDGGPELLPGLVELGSRRDLPAVAGDLLRVRRHLARAVLEHLVHSARPGCARRVGEAVEQFARAVEQGEVAAIAAADVAIVAALLDETGSPVLCLCLNPIVQVVTRMHALRDAIYAEPRGNLEGWRALTAWLEERRPELIDVFAAELEARDQATLRRMRNRK
jgi:DNA-binding FadR family transcriptional regulator